MYGSTVGFNVSFSGNPYKPLTPQNLGLGPVPVNARPADANMSTAWVDNPEAREELTERARQGAERGRHHAAGDQLHRHVGRRPASSTARSA